jgi:AcrR family transcriptional regulator
MGIQERKEREREEKKELILKAAKEIIKEGGIDNLSIRKIASKIEYSPAIIYHYFKDKDEIVNYYIGEEYRKIVGALSGLQEQEGEPEKRFKSSLINYIELALKMPEAYKSVMFNDSDFVLQHTSVLFEGASKERPTMKILCKFLKESYFEGFEDSFIELTAQVIWSSIFGLVSRLIIDKKVGENHKHKLIEYHVDFIIKGLKDIKN